jgi:hypothetical protein
LIRIFDHPNRQFRPVPTVENLNGEYYVIEKILSYDPKKGYLVKWKEFPDSANSWQLSKDMPPSFRKQMEVARKRYRATKN